MKKIIVFLILLVFIQGCSFGYKYTKAEGGKQREIFWRWGKSPSKIITIVPKKKGIGSVYKKRILSEISYVSGTVSYE